MTDLNKEVKAGAQEGEGAGEGKKCGWCGHCGCRCGRRFWKWPFIIAAIVAVKGALVLFLWNALVPDLFHGPNITFVQAVELAILAKVLVGFGGHHWGRHRGHHWKGKWAALSPEEREKLRDQIRKRCGE